jgi:hypothetical protein
MTFCRECDTCAHCLRNGCIPIQPEPLTFPEILPNLLPAPKETAA